MRRHLQVLFKDAAVYGLASGLSRFVKILLVPIVARSLPVAEFGVFDAVSVYTFVAAMAAVVGLDSAVVLIARRADGGTDPAAARGTALTTVVGIGVLLASVGVAGRDLWSRLLLDSTPYGDVIAWAAVSVPFSAVLMYLLGLLKWEFRRGWFLAASLGSAAASVGLTWYVAVATSLGLPGLMAATTAGQVIGAGIAVWGARDLIAPRWSSPAARRLFATGLPFAVIGVTSAAAPSIDRLFLAHAHSLADTGVYGVGQRLAMLQAILLGGFQAAWGPFAYSMADASEKPAVFSRVFLLVTAAGGYMTLMLVLIAPWLAVVAAGDNYAGASTYVTPLGLSVTLGTVYFVVSIGAFIEERTMFTLYAYVAGVVATLGLNVALFAVDAPPVGIAWANCLGQLAAVSFMGFLSHRVHPLPYPYVTGAVLLTASAALGSWLASQGLSTTAAVLVGATLTTGFGTLAWFTIAAGKT